MSNDGWGIENAVPKGVQDSLARNLDVSGELLPERALLHEVIIQAVTERRVQADPTRDFDEQLYQKVDEIRSSDTFAELAEKGEFTQEDISRLLDNAGMDRLPTVPQAQHTTIMVTGGPATGKTALVNSVQAQRPDIVDNAARINPDDYRALFASPGEFGQAYADMAQLECNKISKAIMSRLQERIATGDAPHVLLDVVSPNERRMALANESNELIVVAGTKSPEAAVEHSFVRGQPRVDDVTGITVPGRQTPTFVVLEGAAKASGSNPEIFQHPNVSFELFDTNTGRNPETGRFNPPKSIASWDPDTKTMTVHDPDTFINFVERQNLSDQARSADELFSQADRTPASIADNLSAYTDRGITVEFENPETNRVAMAFTPEGVEVNEQLLSNRGHGFFNDLAEESGTKVVSLDAARSARLTDSFSDAARNADEMARLADLARAADAAKLGASAARLAKVGVVTTVAATAAGVLLTNEAHGAQQELAREYMEQGRLSPEAAEAYIQMNEEVRDIVIAETTVNQTPIVGTLIGMAATEAIAKEKFDEWREEYGPIDEDIYQSLKMDMLGGHSLKGEFAMAGRELIPDTMSELPSSLHALWEAEQRLEHAENQADRRVGSTRDPERQAQMRKAHEERQDALKEAETAYQQEFDKVLSNPETAQELLSRMPQDMLLEMVTATAQNNAEGQNPLIQRLAEAQESLDSVSSGRGGNEKRAELRQELNEIKAELNQNPSIMYDYVRDVFGGQSTDDHSVIAAYELEADGQFSSMTIDERNSTLNELAQAAQSSEELRNAHPYVRELANLTSQQERLDSYDASGRYYNKHRARIEGQRDAVEERLETVRAELAENPEIIDWLSSESDTVNSIIQNNGNNEIILSDFSGSDATYIGDPSMAAETAEAGISVNPALLPPEQIAAVSNTVRPQIPQL